MRKSILWCIRILLFLLILCNMALIYNFSAENAEKSTITSNEITENIAQITIKDFNKKEETEKQEIVSHMSVPIRKIAHMTEFGTLGLLILMLAMTWKKWICFKWLGSITLTFLYALTDEYHQGFVEGRGPQFKDVLIDTTGALVLTTLFLFVWVVMRGFVSNKLVVTSYDIIHTDKKCKMMYISDLHGCGDKLICDKICEEKPNVILLGGDLTDYTHMLDKNDKVYSFLRYCAQFAPTFYALGNHEIGSFRKGNFAKRNQSVGITEEIRTYIAQTGVQLLEDDYKIWNDLSICGITSGLNANKNEPNIEKLKEFSNLDGYKILLCHHPEYYDMYLKNLNFSMILCGHAHGGHWRVFGHGIFAPGQGLFPKYTSGVIDEKCYISRGAGDHTKIPRFYNHREIIVLNLGGK